MININTLYQVVRKIRNQVLNKELQNFDAQILTEIIDKLNRVHSDEIDTLKFNFLKDDNDLSKEIKRYSVQSAKDALIENYDGLITQIDSLTHIIIQYQKILALYEYVIKTS